MMSGGFSLCMLRSAGAVRPVSRVTRPIRRRLREGEGQGKGKGLLAKKGQVQGAGA